MTEEKIGTHFFQTEKISQRTHTQKKKTTTNKQRQKGHVKTPVTRERISSRKHGGADHRSSRKEVVLHSSPCKTPSADPVACGDCLASSALVLVQRTVASWVDGRMGGRGSEEGEAREKGLRGEWKGCAM